MRTVRDFAALIFVGTWLLVTLSACETSKHAEIMSTEALRAQAQMATAPDTDTDTESDQSGIHSRGNPSRQQVCQNHWSLLQNLLPVRHLLPALRSRHHQRQSPRHRRQHQSPCHRRQHQSPRHRRQHQSPRHRHQHQSPRHRHQHQSLRHRRQHRNLRHPHQHRSLRHPHQHRSRHP